MTEDVHVFIAARYLDEQTVKCPFSTNYIVEEIEAIDYDQVN